MSVRDLRRPTNIVDLIRMAKEIQVSVSINDSRKLCNLKVAKETMFKGVPCWVFQIWTPELSAKAIFYISKEDGTPLRGRFTIFEYDQGLELEEFYMYVTTPIRIFLQQQDYNIIELVAAQDTLGKVEELGTKRIHAGGVIFEAYGYRVVTSELSRRFLMPIAEGEYWMSEVEGYSVVVRSKVLFTDGTRVGVTVTKLEPWEGKGQDESTSERTSSISSG